MSEKQNKMNDILSQKATAEESSQENFETQKDIENKNETIEKCIQKPKATKNIDLSINFAERDDDGCEALFLFNDELNKSEMECNLYSQNINLKEIQNKDSKNQKVNPKKRIKYKGKNKCFSKKKNHNNVNNSKKNYRILKKIELKKLKKKLKTCETKNANLKNNINIEKEDNIYDSIINDEKNFGYLGKKIRGDGDYNFQLEEMLNVNFADDDKNGNNFYFNNIQISMENQSTYNLNNFEGNLWSAENETRFATYNSK
jgi:hypothetical protein